MAKDLEVKNESRNRTPAASNSFPDMDRMIDTFFDSPFGSWMQELPNLPRRTTSDIKETDSCYLMSAELPGMPKENIEISVNGNLLTVHAEQKDEQNENQGFRREYRSFHQSFALPSTVDASKIEAHYENGMLEVMLPKTEQAQSKKIDVQTGKGGFWDRILGTKKVEGAKNANESKH